MEMRMPLFARCRPAQPRRGAERAGRRAAAIRQFTD